MDVVCSETKMGHPFGTIRRDESRSSSTLLFLNHEIWKGRISASAMEKDEEQWCAATAAKRGTIAHGDENCFRADA